MVNRDTSLLESARRDLFVAVKLSRQGASHRRTPSPECLPHYGSAKYFLERALEVDPENRDALLMMSQISEGLMRFDDAISFLHKAFAAGEPRNKKHLKRLALLQENVRYWQTLILTPDELRDLGEFLESQGVGPAMRSRRYTEQWLDEHYEGDTAQVLNGLDEVGAFSDFQILANVVYG